MNKKPKKNKTIGLLGLANVGKSTIFNLLLPKISEKQDIGNWSGVTLDTRKSKIDFFSKKIQFIDAPGSVFMENIEINKKETLNYVFGSKCDFFINIVNGLHLEENLYFTLILKEMGIPFLMIINFADRIDKNVHINIQKLEKFFDTKILITSAIKNYSKKQIKKFIFDNIDFEFQKKTFFYSDKITKLNKKIQICLKNNNNFSNYVKKVKIKSSFFLPHISFKIIQKNDVILKLVKSNDFDYLKINKIIANFEKENSLQCDRNLIFRRENY